MKTKKITNQKELVMLQRAMTEIVIFDLDFQRLEKGGEINLDIITRVQKAATTIILTLPKI